MKKTRFLFATCLLVMMLALTGCGNQRDVNNDAIPDDQQNNTIEQDVDNVGDDIRDGVDDVADDVKDAMDGDNKDNNNAGTDKNDNTDKNGKTDKTDKNMGQ